LTRFPRRTEATSPENALPGEHTLRELVRTNDAVLVSAIQALLDAAEIPHIVLDQNMSVLEGSLGILPRRILVHDEHQESARRLLADAGLSHELRPGPVGEGTDRTDDAVLGGRLRLTQKRRGHRVGHDAILLAAATGARPGDRAVDLGAGVGAAGLALAVRVSEVTVTLVEIDPALAEIAAENIARNGLDARVSAVALDVAGPADTFSAYGLGPGSADQVLMNPPFNNPDSQNASPDPDRRSAHVAPVAALADWVAAAVRLLHSAGALTMIWRADGLAHVLAALDQRFGGLVVLPIHGRAGDAAIRVLVRATKGNRAPLTLLPGLVLNDASGRPTAEAESILRDGAALPLNER
jgi:tRNA1(Val) A37 N6-methylase TrmN6